MDACSASSASVGAMKRVFGILERRAALVIERHVIVVARVHRVQRAQQRRRRLVGHLHALEQEAQLAVAMEPLRGRRERDFAGRASCLREE